MPDCGLGEPGFLAAEFGFEFVYYEDGGSIGRYQGCG